MSDKVIPTSTSPLGWVCQRCGSWIPGDSFHVCGVSQSGVSQTGSAQPDNYTRIIELLEQILAVLEQIKRKQA